jgi:hypothetical protein
MSEHDIRTTGVAEITSIKFFDIKQIGTSQIKDCYYPISSLNRSTPGLVFLYNPKWEKEDRVYIENIEHAENLIKAIQFAISKNWFPKKPVTR